MAVNTNERYFWDLTRHLVIHNVLTQAQVAAANAKLDYLADRCENGDTLTRDNVPFLGRIPYP
jgi:hypothetical protein